MPQEQFVRHWGDIHAPMADTTPRLHRYVQSVILAETGDVADPPEARQSLTEARQGVSIADKLSAASPAVRAVDPGTVPNWGRRRRHPRGLYSSLNQVRILAPPADPRRVSFPQRRRLASR